MESAKLESDWLRHQNLIPFSRDGKSVTIWLWATSSSFVLLIWHYHSRQCRPPNLPYNLRGELPTNRVSQLDPNLPALATRIPPHEVLVKPKLLLSTRVGSHARHESPYPHNRLLSDHTSSWIGLFSTEPIVGWSYRDGVELAINRKAAYKCVCSTLFCE